MVKRLKKADKNLPVISAEPYLSSAGYGDSLYLPVKININLE